MLYFHPYASPCGPLILATTADQLCFCEWKDSHNYHTVLGRVLSVFQEKKSCDDDVPKVMKQAIQELNEYFASSRTTFDVPIRLVGTSFQNSVWKALLSVPYGRTMTYADMAERVGKSRTSSRSVAQAIGANPLNIFIPCHRIIGCNGQLTGYAGGLAAKQKLLEMERENKAFSTTTPINMPLCIEVLRTVQRT